MKRREDILIELSRLEDCLHRMKACFKEKVHEEPRITLTEAVKRTMPQGKFTLEAARRAVLRDYPKVVRSKHKSSLNSALRNLAVHGKVKMLEGGKGRRPSLWENVIDQK